MFELIKKAPIRVNLSIAFLVALFSFLTSLGPIGFGITMLVLALIVFSAAAILSIGFWIVEVIEEY